MSLPYSMTFNRLSEIFDYLHECINQSFQEFNEYEFLKTFLIKDDFIFNFRRYYLLDELVLTAYLKHGIEMEYNDILKDAEGNELCFDQCRNLVRWFLGDEFTDPICKAWKPMKDIDSKFDINNSIYSLFKKHIRENISNDLNVKSKFEKKEEKIINSEGVVETTNIYYAFIGLQAGRGLPIGFTEFNLREQARHKRQDYIYQYNQETKMIKAFNEKIDKSAKICKRFLRKVARKYHNPNNVSGLCGKLVDNIISYGLKLPTKEANKLSEQIYDRIKSLIM